MVYRNLVPGQYQFGDIVMGRGTNIRVDSFDVKPYDVNNQDFQVIRSDEMRFGIDAFKPTTIEIQMDVLNNRLLDDFVNDIPNFWHDMPSHRDIAALWRNDAGRVSWGQMEPFYFCGKDGIGKVIYGRPGQFGLQHETEYSDVLSCLGEFRRADTLAYSVEEYAVELSSNADPNYLTRGDGDQVDTWLRILLEGPITNPVITIGENEIKLVNTTIAAGETVEISSYPWLRRVINDQGVNLAQQISGTTPYLDRFKLPWGVPIPVRWTSDDFTTFVPALGNQDWGTDIGSLNYKNIPSTFALIHGRPVVRFDLLNKTGSHVFLGGGLFGTTDACIYMNSQFNTANQYSQARIIEPFPGRTAIVIMSNDTMTNFAFLEIESGIATHRMHLGVGSSYSSCVRKASWTTPGPWDENQNVGVGYDPDTNTFQAYLSSGSNAPELIDELSWVDSTNLVNKANRRSGYIFNMGGGPLVVGTGLRSLVSYDRATVPADTGNCYLLWRDAWVTV